MDRLSGLIPLWVILAVIGFIVNKFKSKVEPPRKTGAAAPQRERNAAQKKAEPEKKTDERRTAPSNMEFHSLEFHDDVDDDCYTISDSVDDGEAASGAGPRRSWLIPEGNDLVRAVVWGEILNRRQDQGLWEDSHERDAESDSRAGL